MYVCIYVNYTILIFLICKTTIYLSEIDLSLLQLNLDNSNLYRTTISIPFRSVARTFRRRNKIADALFYLGNSNLEQSGLY